MDELVKLLDRNLDYVSHTNVNNMMEITVKSNREFIKCPHCGKESKRVHSRYFRSLQDLPIQGKKVKIIIDNKKMFCDNENCEHVIYAEQFDFLQKKAKKSNRLKDMIIEVSLTQSSLNASRYLEKNVADVKKSTICNYIKKKKSQ